MTNVSDPRERMPEVQMRAVLNETPGTPLLRGGGLAEEV